MATARRNGRLVALGRYQITKPVWFQHTNRPWKLAHNFHFATIVAERHLAWLEKHLNPNPFDLAVGWRFGVNFTGYPDDYPHRVHDLYYASRT